MITLDGIDKRIARLAQLARGLAKESADLHRTIGEALERHEVRLYVERVLDAVAAADEARYVLEVARRRVAREREERERRAANGWGE